MTELSSVRFVCALVKLSSLPCGVLLKETVVPPLVLVGMLNLPALHSLWHAPAMPRIAGAFRFGAIADGGDPRCPAWKLGQRPYAAVPGTCVNHLTPVVVCLEMDLNSRSLPGKDPRNKPAQRTCAHRLERR